MSPELERRLRLWGEQVAVARASPEVVLIESAKPQKPREYCVSHGGRRSIFPMAA